MRSFAAVVLFLLSGCATYYVRASMLEETEDGGSMVTPIEDDSLPDEQFSRQDAERQMAAHCAPRSYKIVKRSKFETGSSTDTEWGFGFSSRESVWLTRLDYVCVK